MRKLSLYFLLLGIVVLFTTSCDNGNGNGDVQKKFLVDAEKVELSTPIDLETTKTLLRTYGLDDIADKLLYEVEVYKITYKTRFMGDTIFVSGVVACPLPENKKDEFPVISYQHGTIVKNADAPSEYPENEVMLRMASAGAIVVVPDYIGFGASASEFHPYMINEYTVNSILDMVRASFEFIDIEEPCNRNEQLYMMGYSQGGSATLAAVSAVQNNNANSDLNVSLAVCGSGAYNLTTFRTWVMNQPRYTQPALIAYILKSFKTYVAEDVTYDQVFSSDYAAMIDDMFDGSKGIADINTQFGTEHIGELFNDNFENEDSFTIAPEYLELRNAFDDNSVAAWSVSTETSIALVYGTDDITVPSEQSLKMWQEFQGANAGVNVTLKRIEGGTHLTTFLPTVQYAMDWFIDDEE